MRMMIGARSLGHDCIANRHHRSVNFDLVANNLIGREAHQRLVVLVYFPTAQELIEPITSATLPALFQLDGCDTMEVAIPFRSRLVQSGDVRAYAKNFSDFIRAFTEPIIRMSFGSEQFGTWPMNSLIQSACA